MYNSKTRKTLTKCQFYLISLILTPTKTEQQYSNKLMNKGGISNNDQCLIPTTCSFHPVMVRSIFNTSFTSLYTITIKNYLPNILPSTPTHIIYFLFFIYIKVIPNKRETNTSLCFLCESKERVK